MTEEELKNATGQELIEQRNYCGTDNYYRDYLDNVNAEMLRRFNHIIELKKESEQLKQENEHLKEQIKELKAQIKVLEDKDFEKCPFRYSDMGCDYCDWRDRDLKYEYENELQEEAQRHKQRMFDLLVSKL